MSRPAHRSADDLLDPLGGPSRGGDVLVWTITLPADPAAADARLDTAARRSEDIDRALARAPGGVERAVEQAVRPRRASFDLGRRSPEAMLADALRGERRGTQVAFSVLEADDDRGLLARVQARLNALIDDARYAARVETRVDGRLIAVSTIGWGGDADSAIATDADDATLRRHHRAISLVTRTRQSRLRFAVIVIAGAARVAASVAAGGLSALPAIYRFVEQVLDGYDDLETARPHGGHPA